MTRHGKRSSKTRGGWTLIGCGVIGVLSLTVLQADYTRTTTQLEQVVAATDNLMVARLAVARSHLAWERFAGGDSTFDPSRSLAELDVASGRVSDLLEGRSSLLGFRASALDEEATRRPAGDLRRDITDLRRILLSPESEILDPVELQVRFDSLDDEATQLHHRVQDALRGHLERGERFHFALLASWTLFLGFVAGGIWTLQRRTSRAELGARVAEAEKAAVEVRYANLRALMDAGVVRTDGAGRILEATKWWERVGVPEDEWVGSPWWEILMPADRPGAEMGWKAKAKAGGAFPMEVHLRGDDGTERWLTARWRPLEHDGSDVERGWVGTFLDVTEHRSVEAQLRQAQKLEAVGEMTGGIAHDFNNLLTVVLSNVQLLRLEEAELSSSVSDMLGDIQRAAENGRDLIARLMSFSRRSELSIERVDLSDVVTDSMNLAKRMLPDDVQAEVRTPENRPRVSADPQRIQQALLNLVSNARDAMPDGGRLIVEVDEVEADEESVVFEPWVLPGRYGRVTVSDTGVGMEHETLSKIFEPFFSTKVRGKGTGLGLSSVHGIVRQHGGHINVYSEPGQGTTFRIYLPAADQRPEEPVEASSGADRAGPAERSLRILLVEDDDGLRRTARAVLTRLGHEVEVAQDGSEALEVLSSTRSEFHLVVSDMAMRGMDGLELHSRLRESGSSLPFIFTSGRVESQTDWNERFSVDAVFLAKPWSIPDLKAAIEKAITLA